MSASLSFVVEGIPRPQGSKRHVGGGRMVESSRYLAAWRKAVGEAAMLARPGRWQLTSEPVTVSCGFYFAEPKVMRSPVPTGRPDVDKLLRAILDACTGVLWEDDAQVVRLEGWKGWTTGAPAASVSVNLIAPPVMDGQGVGR